MDYGAQRSRICGVIMSPAMCCLNRSSTMEQNDACNIYVKGFAVLPDVDEGARKRFVGAVHA